MAAISSPASPRTSLWATVASGCLVASLLSALQIYARQWLAGGTPSLTNQLALNLVAWLPWLPLALLVSRFTAAVASRSACSWTRRLAAHVGMAQLASLSYLVYLALFRFAFLPHHTVSDGALSTTSFGQQIAIEAGDFYMMCLTLYTLVVGVTLLLEQLDRSNDAHAAPVAELGGITPRTSPAANATAADDHGDVLTIRSARGTELVPIETIDWIEADGSYARLHMGDSQKLLRRTLKSLETSLRDHGFLRIHRSRIIRLDRIKRLRPLSHGDTLVEITGGQELRASRRYAAELRRRSSPGLGQGT